MLILEVANSFLEHYGTLPSETEPTEAPPPHTEKKEAYNFIF